MAAIITEKFRQHNAEQFYESFSETSASNYYLFIGKTSPFTSTTSGSSDTTPPTPQDTITLDNYKWDSMIAAKRIGTTDVTFVIPRRNYANGTTYDMYEHNISSSNTTDSGATNLFDSTYYFITDEYKVYKVLDNNGGTAIAAGATGLHLLTLTLSLKVVIIYSICTHYLHHKFRSLLLQTLFQL